MRTDLIEQLHDGSGAGEGDLADGDGAGGEELGGLALQCVEGVQAEERVHQGLGVLVQSGRELGGGDGVVEVLDDQVLGVGGGQAPEVDEEAVPGALLGVAVLEGLEGQVGCAPGEGGDDVGILLQDVEGGALVAAVQVAAQNAGGVVVGSLAGENGAGRFEQLLQG